MNRETMIEKAAAVIVDHDHNGLGACVMTTLTTEEQAEMDEHVASLIADGFYEIDEFTYRDKTLKPGTRVLHCGERWHEAMRDGTANILRIFRQPPGCEWERDWDRPNVEVVALSDKPRITTSRIGKWADYHCRIPYEVAS